MGETGKRGRINEGDFGFLDQDDELILESSYTSSEVFKYKYKVQRGFQPLICEFAQEGQ